jgi:hypothetical protein
VKSGEALGCLKPHLSSPRQAGLHSGVIAMRKTLFGFLLKAPVAIKEFGERAGIVRVAVIGKSLNEFAKRHIKAGQAN